MPFAIPRPKAQAGWALAAPGFTSAAFMTAAPLWVGPRVTTGAMQWYRGTASVSGQTNASYQITSSDSGQTVACYASATNPWGSGVAVARRYITLA